MAGKFIAGDFLAHAVTFGEFMAGDLLGGYQHFDTMKLIFELITIFIK